MPTPVGRQRFHGTFLIRRGQIFVIAAPAPTVFVWQIVGHLDGPLCVRPVRLPGRGQSFFRSLGLHIDKCDPGVALRCFKDRRRTLDADGPILRRNECVSKNGGLWGIAGKALRNLCAGRVDWPDGRALALSQQQGGTEDQQKAYKNSFHGSGFSSMFE